MHYHFTTKPQMEKDIADGLFLEHAHVHGNIYGTSVAAEREVAAGGKCCILDIDVQGARQVHPVPYPEAYPDPDPKPHLTPEVAAAVDLLNA